jgi:hypothetical protein
MSCQQELTFFVTLTDRGGAISLCIGSSTNRGVSILGVCRALLFKESNLGLDIERMDNPNPSKSKDVFDGFDECTVAHRVHREVFRGLPK